MKTYTFHVSLRGGGRVWRKIEMLSDQTLEELHFAIQDAFEWDADHLYSFFMSNRAWDESSEYCLPEGVSPWGDDLDAFDDLDEEDEEAGEEVEEVAEDQVAEAGAELADGEVAPLTPAELAEMIQTEEVAARLAMLGLMPEDVQAALAAMQDATLTPEEKLARVSPVLDTLNDYLFGPEDAGDVRTTQLEELELKVGKKFLYLFDYGDEHEFQVRVHAINPDAPEADYPVIVESRGQAPAQYPDEEEWDEELEEDADE